MMAQLAYVPFVLAATLSAAITYLTILMYRALGIVDRSTAKEHPKHIHTQPVPRGGGLPIFFAMFFTTIMFAKFDGHMAGIFAGAFILMGLGILDDIMDLSPYLRLVLGVVAAMIVVFAGIGIAFVSNPFGGAAIHFISPDITMTILGQVRTFNVLGSLLTILWITWGMNFVNMGAKGLDGQLPGVVVIAAIVMGILSFRFVNDVTSWPSSYLSFALAGAYAGFLLFNVYPQRIMPGWGGGSLAGYFLAILAILSGAKVATAIIVLGVPLMDVVYAIIRRIRAGRSPVWGDAMHLHHQLLRLGWSKRAVAGLYWLVTAILGAAALQLNSRMKIYTIFLVGVAVGGVLLWINLYISQRQRAQHSG